MPLDGMIAFLLRSLILISFSRNVLWMWLCSVGDHDIGRLVVVALYTGHSKLSEAFTMKEKVGKLTLIC